MARAAIPFKASKYTSFWSVGDRLVPIGWIVAACELSTDLL